MSFWVGRAAFSLFAPFDVCKCEYEYVRGFSADLGVVVDIEVKRAQVLWKGSCWIWNGIFGSGGERLKGAVGC
jgi:hypothetical protein